MDTKSELERDAAMPHEDKLYTCPIPGCDSAGVPDIGDLTLCEKCRRRVCDGHARKRAAFQVCLFCDRKEWALLMTFVLPELDKMAHLIRAKMVTAEEVQLQLASIGIQASDIEGEV